MREFMTAEEVNLNHIYFVSSVVDILQGLVIILRRPRLLRYNETVVGHCVLRVLDDVSHRVLGLQVLCNIRSVLVVDQCDPICSGSELLCRCRLTSVLW